MTRPDPVRQTILDLKPSGITKVTLLGLGNPDVLPLWFGETDLVTPPFIRQAAIKALEDGNTFYTNARGILPLREAIARFPQAHHRRRYSGRAHHHPRRRHAGRGDGAADGVRERRQCGDRLADLAQHLPGHQSRGRRAPAGAAGRRLDCRPLASGPRQAVRRL